MTSISLLFAALIGLASWLLPNHYPPWLSFHAELLMAVAFAVALAGTLWSDRRARDPVTPLFALTLGLAVVPLLQALTGLVWFAGDAWMAAAYLLGFALAQLLGQRLARRFGAEAVLQSFALLFVVSSLLNVALALYQWLSLSGLGIFATDLPPNGRPFANVAQPNHLATMLFLGLVGTLFLHQRAVLGNCVALLLALFIEFGLAMSTSRTAWLAMALLCLGLWLAQRRAALRVTRTGVAALGAAFVGWLVVWPLLGEALLLSAGRSFAAQSAAGPRTLLWQTAIDEISRKPWFGHGWNQGLVAQSQVVTDHPAGGRLIESSHNLLLDLMVWNGAPLGAAVFGLLGWWAWRHAAAARSGTAVCLLAAIGGVWAHALVEYPLSYAYFLLPVGLLMGALDAHAPPPARWKLPVALTPTLFAVALGLLATISIDYFKIEENTRILRFEVARIGSGRIESEAPSLRLLTQWEAYLRFARVEARAGMSEDELSTMERVAARFPFAASQFKLALAQALNGRGPAAADSLQRLCSMQTTRHCQAHLSQWRELTQTTYPQLAATRLPAMP